MRIFGQMVEIRPAVSSVISMRVEQFSHRVHAAAICLHPCCVSAPADRFRSGSHRSGNISANTRQNKQMNQNRRRREAKVSRGVSQTVVKWHGDLVSSIFFDTGSTCVAQCPWFTGRTDRLSILTSRDNLIFCVSVLLHDRESFPGTQSE